MNDDEWPLSEAGEWEGQPRNLGTSASMCLCVFAYKNNCAL